VQRWNKCVKPLPVLTYATPDSGLTYTKPTACRSSWIRIAKGGIWFCLRSNEGLNLDSKTVLYVAFYLDDVCFNECWIDNFLLRIIEKWLEDGEVLYAPSHKRSAWFCIHKVK